MKRGMYPVGAGGLIWLMATACGETSSNSDPEPSDSDGANATGSMGPATTGGAMGTGTPNASSAGDGAVGSSTTGGGTAGASCPNFEPAPGASCPDEGVSCAFANCVEPNFRNNHTLTCQDGAWVLTDDVECLPDCPATPAVIGGFCDEAATPGPCPTPHPCGTAYAYCSDGQWSLQVSGRAPEPNPGPDGAGGASDIIALICPGTAPALGSDCCPSHYPSTCDYRGQGGSGVGGSGSGFAPPPGTTGAQGGASTTGATGATGSNDGAGAGGPTGGTGGYASLCRACDPTSMKWIVSDACE